MWVLLTLLSVKLIKGRVHEILEGTPGIKAEQKYSSIIYISDAKM